MDTITLKKYKGRGNSYLILDPNKNDVFLQERNIEMLCKRNFGSNASALLYGPIVNDGKIMVRMYDKDGKEADRYEGGICVFAKYLLDDGYIKEDEFILSDEQGGVEMHFFNKEMAHFLTGGVVEDEDYTIAENFFS
ncbi:MAG: hypothetical protein ACI4C5_04765 [Lachnospiraceae bacterium]